MAGQRPPVLPDALFDQLLAGADAKTAFDRGGLLDELKNALAERASNAEMDHHLDAGEGDGDRRNGYGKKMVLTGTGKFALGVPRYRPPPDRHDTMPSGGHPPRQFIGAHGHRITGEGASTSHTNSVMF